MKGKKVLSLLCAVTMASTLLAGCGGAKTDSQKQASSTASKTSESTSKASSMAANTADTSEHVEYLL